MTREFFKLKQIDTNEGMVLYVGAEDTAAQHYINLGTERDCAVVPTTFVKEPKVCIQAGGNIGYFPIILSEMFEQVYTFEPDPMNFLCLTMNAPSSNIIKSQFALGDEHGTAGMVYCAEHNGMNHINPEGAGTRIIRVDDLGLDRVDLILFDMEGFEFPALKGAENLIRQHKPVLSIAFEGHESRYGYKGDEVETWIKDLGYEFQQAVHCDRIFVPTP